MTPTRLAVSAPHSERVGSSFLVSARAIGKHGKLAEAYRGRVRFTSTDKAAKLPKPYRFKRSDRGHHRFRVTLRSAGRQTITIVDSAHHKIAGRVNITESLQPTVTSVSCTPRVLSGGKSAPCTGTVTKSFGSARPAGTLAFTTDPNASFSPTSCTLPGSGPASCSVSLTSNVDGNHIVTATFTPASSDSTDHPSHGIEVTTGCADRWTVDVSTGSDSDAGTCAAPFASITKALSVAQSGDTVLVMGGTYSTGETFPLVPLGGVTVTGQAGNIPVIHGGIDFNSDTVTVEDVTVEDATVSSSGSDGDLVDATVTGSSGDCVSVTAGSLYVTDDTINECGGVGVDSSGSSYTDVYGTALTDSNINVQIVGAASGAVEQSTISCASSADLASTTSSNIDADHDMWDHAPPTESFSGVGDGIDIYDGGTGTVLPADYSLTADPCP